MVQNIDVGSIREAAMIDRPDADGLRLKYEGPLDSGFLDVAERSIDAEFEALDEPERHRLLDVLVELAHNAVRYGVHPRRHGQIAIGPDARGMYVEVSSIGTKSEIDRVYSVVQKIKGMDNDRLEREELRASLENLGTNQSGLGLYQVVRRAKWSDMGRMIDVEVKPAGAHHSLRIRAYVS